MFSPTVIKKTLFEHIRKSWTRAGIRTRCIKSAFCLFVFCSK